ncbi:MAG TPA: hypothetical protein VFA46_08905 [Actinomycetes bacterium]|nr:hypothetical protein [Actinomycetes bacterium]
MISKTTGWLDGKAIVERCHRAAPDDAIIRRKADVGIEGGDRRACLPAEHAVGPELPQDVAEFHERLLDLGDRSLGHAGLERRLT